jgi:hypothetical protein
MRLNSCILALALALIWYKSPLITEQASPSGKPSPAPSPTQEIPTIDGGAGPCSVDLTVTDGQGKRVYAATVKVHIAYGFGGVRKLDLEAGTNSDGKVRFTGLPFKIHNPPLEFRATKDDLTGLATVNPATECQAKHDMILEKVKPPASQ